jgi:hypothetical protein
VVLAVALSYGKEVHFFAVTGHEVNKCCQNVCYKSCLRELNKVGPVVVVATREP